MGNSTIEISQIPSSDAMHNRNCYIYLLKLKSSLTPVISDLLPTLEKVDRQYNKDYQYGDLYTSFLTALEELIEKDGSLEESQKKALNNLIYTIYHNDNGILGEERSEWMKTIKTTLQRDHGKSIRKSLDTALKTTINKRSPESSNAIVTRALSLFDPNFKPQLITNIPTIKRFSYTSKVPPTEYRFCTQAQRHEGKVRVSPLFRRFLQIQASRFKALKITQEITHIYFNNLGYDRALTDIEGTAERELSLALHKLEETEPNILVITLPAHQGLLAESDYLKTKETQSYQAVLKEFLTIARREKPAGTTDFFISPKARAILFGSDELPILTKLLTESFKALGMNKPILSIAQKQAVWVHFIKYELTNHIINKVKPQSYNFSCKDAIDRGAVSSTYYNLMKSFAAKAPISKEEFERSLDAAAVNVKGRGMNFHRKIIWNAIDVYVDAQYRELIKDKRKSWLIYWRDMNCPHKRVKELIPERIDQGIALINQLKQDKDINEKVNRACHKLFLAARAVNNSNVSGKRLLLEAISRTCQLATAPSKELMDDYRVLAEQMTVNYPALKIIGGIMKMILGLALYIPSIGYSHSLVKEGYATFNAGFFYQQRNALVGRMNQLEAVIQPQIPS